MNPVPLRALQCSSRQLSHLQSSQLAPTPHALDMRSSAAPRCAETSAKRQFSGHGPIRAACANEAQSGSESKHHCSPVQVGDQACDAFNLRSVTRRRHCIREACERLHLEIRIDNRNRYAFRTDGRRRPQLARCPGQVFESMRVTVTASS